MYRDWARLLRRVGLMLPKADVILGMKILSFPIINIMTSYMNAMKCEKSNYLKRCSLCYLNPVNCHLEYINSKSFNFKACSSCSLYNHSNFEFSPKFVYTYFGTKCWTRFFTWFLTLKIYLECFRWIHHFFQVYQTFFCLIMLPISFNINVSSLKEICTEYLVMLH